MKKALFAFTLLLSFSSLTFAQTTDSLSSPVKSIKHRKNNVKINMTSFLLYRPGIIATYERVINKSQTVSIMGGYVETPVLLNINSDKLHLKDNVNKSGYMAGLEYRFYLKKENKFMPPHGVYLGPYASYYHFHNNRTVSLTSDVTNADINLITNINVANLGLQIGYQFVIAKRFSIDLVMFGPALSWYQFNIQMQSTTNSGDLSEEEQDILNNIGDKAPVLGELLSGASLSKDGRADVFAGGFRYAIQLGFCF